MNMAVQKEWLSLTEACRELNINGRTLKRVIRENNIPTRPNVLNKREVLVNMPALLRAINPTG